MVMDHDAGNLRRYRFFAVLSDIAEQVRVLIEAAALILP